MTSKLNQILESEHLTATKLAEILEIQPSGISHILRNRNKPSYDFVVKLLRRFPRINPDWLLLDSGQMYRDDKPTAAPAETQTPKPAATENTLFDSLTANTYNNMERAADYSQTADSAEQPRQTSYSSKEIERIVIFYTDQTCECYKNR